MLDCLVSEMREHRYDFKVMAARAKRGQRHAAISVIEQNMI